MRSLSLFSILILSSLTAAFPAAAPTTRQLGSTATRNDLVSGTCKPVTVIFARGTTEPGNVGAVAGPPFFDALSQKFGAENVAVQGVDYAATAAGFSGDPQGNAEMARLVNLAATQCGGSGNGNGTSVVVSGYSQGAMLVHNSASQFSEAGRAAVKAAVVFGDPFAGRPISGIPASNVKTFCATGDAVCLGTAIITPAHLSYGQDAGAAADFVATKVQR